MYMYFVLHVTKHVHNQVHVLTLDVEPARRLTTAVRVLRLHRVLALVLHLTPRHAQLVRQTRVLGHVLEARVERLSLERPRDDGRTGGGDATLEVRHLALAHHAVVRTADEARHRLLAVCRRKIPAQNPLDVNLPCVRAYQRNINSQVPVVTRFTL